MSGIIVLALRLAAALVLYIFLGWMLYTLWREVQRNGQILATRQVPGIQLTLLQEGESLASKYFTKPEIILGRDPNSDILLNDSAVSTRHAQLSYHHGQWWLEDLASTNGTILNDIKVNMPTVIMADDEIQCGAIRLTVAFSPDTKTPITQNMEH